MTSVDPDPVGQLLRDGAASVSAEVSPPDVRLIMAKHRRRRANSRILRIGLAAGAAVAVAAAVIVTTLPGTDGRPQARAYHVRFGGHTLAVKDLLLAQRAAPVIARANI